MCNIISDGIILIRMDIYTVDLKYDYTPTNIIHGIDRHEQYNTD